MWKGASPSLVVLVWSSMYNNFNQAIWGFRRLGMSVMATALRGGLVNSRLGCAPVQWAGFLKQLPWQIWARNGGNVGMGHLKGAFTNPKRHESVEAGPPSSPGLFNFCE